jgi:uncharacterized protein (TIGR02145 family)
MKMKTTLKLVVLLLTIGVLFVACDQEIILPIQPPTYTLTTSISPAESGVINVSPQSPIYQLGDVLTLTPAPTQGWVFDKWEGDASGNANPLPIIIRSNQSIRGVFKRRNYPLNISIIGEGTVEERIVSNPTGREYPFETVVELTPIPKEGWVFDVFSGDLTGNTTPQTITVDKEKNVTVKFKRKDYPLNITIIGEGTVEEKIVSNPSGRLYPFQTVVELTPIPKEGWVFDGFSGDLTGTTTPQTITVDKEKNVTVRFKRRDYPLNITIIGEGTVEEKIITNPNQRLYPFQTVVELTPIPKEGWVFDVFSGDLTGNTTPQTITVDKEKNVTVKFKRRDYPLNITIIGEGTVEEKIVSNPSGRLYPFQTVVELTPIPKEGWVFDGFSGDLTGTTTPQTITVDKEKNVTVRFKRRDYPLNITIIGEGTVEEKIITNPNQRLYPFQTVVELTPIPKKGWVFDVFSGDLTGNTTPQTITVDKEKNVTIKFNEIIKFYLHENGITCLCPDTEPGEKGFLNGIQFESVDNNLIRVRRDEGVDMTKLCTSLVTDLSELFRGQPNNTNSFNQPIGNWDVSNVTSMRSMFRDSQFNQPIKDWNVSRVTDMAEMFWNTKFNQPIGNWNVSNVTSMRSMFRESPFNQPIEDWNVSRVTDTGGMFKLSGFNQPIGNWNVSNVTNMNSMFRESQFNQPIGNWNVSRVTDMWVMFAGSQFNQPIGKWNVSNVTNMIGMFWNTPFNQPIGDWDVSNVTNMRIMFQTARDFNQPLKNWNVSSVTDMGWMFAYAGNFNQDISNWDVKNVTDMDRMFIYTKKLNQDISNWDVSKVQNMSHMFFESIFNQPIGDWDVSSVTNMSVMFENSPFDQPISDWDVSAVTNMDRMFFRSKFNQNISKWCVTQISSEPNLFSNESPLTSANKPKWGTCSQITSIVDVTNPVTGQTWMDRNLGATRAATSSTDAASYGDLYQWGRRSDGHQLRTSPTTGTLSSSDQPTHGSFILAPNSPYDWRSPQNTNLWQGVNGTNNPCPSGYRLPTEIELNAERLSWSSNNAAGAIASPLKLPMAGRRIYSNGSLFGFGTYGFYWSSTVSRTDSRGLFFSSSNADVYTYYQADGLYVRCLKDTSPPVGIVGSLDCSTATNNGTLTSGVVSSGVNSIIRYTGGNRGAHSGQAVASTGVTGLTATLTAGTFASGAGSLIYTITGTPATAGTASFAIAIGGQTCTLTRTVAAAQKSEIPTNGLIAWYPFNGNANDESGYGNNGTVNGATLTLDRFGNENRAFSFDGKKSEIIVENLGNNNTWSISLWFNKNNISSFRLEYLLSLGSKKYSTFGEPGFGIQGTSVPCTIVGNNLSFIFDGKQDCQNVVKGQPLERNKWFNIVLKRENNTYSIYSNGILINSGQLSDINIDKLIIGKRLDFYYEGIIDDIAVWNRALTSEEISKIYKGEKF